MRSESGNEPLSHLCGCLYKHLRFNLGLWLSWMSFRDQNVVTAPGTPQTWLREHFDRKKMSAFLDTWVFTPCFPQTQWGFHVVLHLLIDTQYFSCWAKCGNVLFIWHCSNLFNWMEKNILVKWNWCLVATHTHPNNLPLDPVYSCFSSCLTPRHICTQGFMFPGPAGMLKSTFRFSLHLSL